MRGEELVEFVKCVCLARSGEWIRVLRLGFTNLVEIKGVLDVCLCLSCGGVGDVGGRLGLGSERMGLRYICVSCVSGLFV